MKIDVHHGIWSHGGKSTDLVADRLIRIGYDVHNPEHAEFSNVLSASSDARQFAAVLLEQHEPGDCAFAHSHGCLVVLEAMRQGARYDVVVFVGAAIDADVTFPHHGCTTLVNVSNPFDLALGAGAIIPGHPFGPLGKSGYVGPPDDRVEPLVRPSRDGKWNHSAPYFAPGANLAWTVELCRCVFPPPVLEAAA